MQQLLSVLLTQASGATDMFSAQRISTTSAAIGSATADTKQQRPAFVTKQPADTSIRQTRGAAGTNAC